MSKNIIIGIDPGHRGGIAILAREQHLWPMPLMGKEIDWQRVAGLITGIQWSKAGRNKGRVAFIERGHAMSKVGARQSFRYGEAYGGILGLLGALGIPIQIVSPSAWKKVILAGTKKDKPAAIAYCRRRWPSVSLIPEGCRMAHDGMADALCIAAYGETVLGKEQ